MKIVEVEWIDAHKDLSWKPKEALEDFVREDVIITTIGYILEDLDTKVILTFGVDNKDEQYQGFFVIPKGCILNIKEIGKEIKNDRDT